MMAELAPQSSDGSYVRPTYGFKGQLGTAEFPLEEGRYHMYVSTFSPSSKRGTVWDAHGVRVRAAMWAMRARGATA
jgi:glutathionyl-hydroquinone reductase